MKLRIQVEGREYEVEVDTLDPSSVAPACAGLGEAQVPESVLRHRPEQRLPEDSVCRSPIAGRVVAVVAAPGQEVRRHEPVVLVEAMKMEVPIGPAVDGTVKEIFVQAGELVTARQVLFELS